MNEAIDEIRRGESRALAAAGLAPLLKKIRRRLEMLRLSEANLCEAVVAELRRGDDRLAGIAELAGREVWAGDGHFIEHACHDARILHSDDTMRYTALNTIYMKDLRTGAVRPLELCCGSEHEVRVLQRLNIGELRMGGGKGAILVYDSASVDFGLWYRMRQGSGVYVVSRWKSNLRPVASEPLTVDHSDPRNDGILSDERVEWTGHGKFRKITYREIRQRGSRRNNPLRSSEAP